MKTRLMISAAMLIAAVGLTACGGKEAAPRAAPAQGRAVSLGRVEVRPLGGALVASGQLVSREEAVVGSELSGYRVAHLFADEGDWVQAGQPLAQMDATLLKAQLDQQAAKTARAQAEAARVTELDGQGVLSQEQIESRRFSARAEAAALAEQRTRLGRMTITAPVSGLLLQRGVKPGQIAAAGGDAWFVIARDGLVELDAEVNEADLSAIRVGQPAMVTLPGGQTVDGVVRLISPRVDSGTRLGKVRVRLPVRSDLRPGGFAHAAFGAGGRSVAAVPEAAIRYEADGMSIVTVDAANRARQIPVKVGRRGGGWVELVQGPPAGSRIALGGAAFIGDGDLVLPPDTSKTDRQVVR